MSAWHLILALAVAPLIVGCERSNGAPRGGVAVALDTARRSPDEFVGWGFAVPTGSALAVRHRPAGPDFNVYDVVRGADSATVDAPPLLSIYAGDHPEFSGEGLSTTRVAGLPARDRRAVDAAGRVSRDVLLDLPESAETPSRLHAWYGALPSAEAARADSFIARIRPTAAVR